MAKNLIIGGFTNYEINQLKPWVLSAKEVSGDNDVVLVTGKTGRKHLWWHQAVPAEPDVHPASVG